MMKPIFFLLQRINLVMPGVNKRCLRENADQKNSEYGHFHAMKASENYQQKGVFSKINL